MFKFEVEQDGLPIGNLSAVCEIGPQDAIERSEVVGLLSTMLLRHVREDAEAMGTDPLDLLADRLKIERQVLHVAAQQAGIVLPKTKVDAAAEFLAIHQEPQQPDADQWLADRCTRIEIEALERLYALASENIPLVTQAEFRQGAGIDPQLSDTYRAWLSWLETAVCRAPNHPEGDDEMGFGEVPMAIGGTSDEFSPKCVPVYDGFAGIEIEDLGRHGEMPERHPWFWCSPASIVAWPSQQTVADIETVREAGANLSGLWGAISQAMREQRVLESKVVRRNPRRQIEKAEQQITRLRNLRRLDTVESQRELRKQCQDLLGSSAGWKLWNTVIDGVPHTVERQHDGMVEPVARPELGLVSRAEHHLRREAGRKTSQPIGIAWVAMDELPDDPQEVTRQIKGTDAFEVITVPGLRSQIAAHVGVKTWAVQVFFDVSECPWVAQASLVA